ncbi:MAG: hypothetical protein JXA03_14865, partial [Bacteroidales bacterium]|nr:hypothetical protein [Bacteroidales bacterium]
MEFNIQIWKDRIREKLDEFRNTWNHIGSTSVYGVLSATTILPVIEAAQSGNWQALMALGGVLSGIGTGLITNKIQSWKDASSPADEISKDVMDDAGLRDEMDELLQKLQTLEMALEVLPDNEKNRFAGTLKKELEKLGNLTKFEATLGGINISKRVEKSLIVTGRNNTINFIIQEYHKETGKKTGKTALPEQLTQYLEWVCERCSTVELRGIKREGQQVMQLPLEDIYVPLEAEKFVYASGKGKTDPGHSSISLSQLLKAGQKIAVTGGPGCGKTTVLLYIAWVFSRALLKDDPEIAKKNLAWNGQLPIPVFLPLGVYGKYIRTVQAEPDPKTRTLAGFISRYLIEKQSSFGLPDDFFETLLLDGRFVMLLLDGMDEVPEEHERVMVRQAIEELVTNRKNLYVVVTCRTAAYKERTALGKGFREIRVKPLEKEQVDILITKAYQHIFRENKEEFRIKRDELIKGIDRLEVQHRQRAGDNVERLVTSPLMIRMLIIVHFSERTLPDQRAELYMRATDVMLSPEYSPDEAVNQDIGGLVGGSREIHRDLSQHIAFHMHMKGERQGREITEDELRSVISRHKSFPHLADDLIRLVKVRGTVLEERLGSYRFIHLAFQEFLAGRYLAEVLRSEGGISGIAYFLESGPVTESWWREVILLMAGYLCVTGPQNAITLLSRLAGVDDDAAQRRSSVSEDVLLSSAGLSGTACLEWKTLSPGLNRKIADRIASLFKDDELMSRSRPQFRALAGDTLARLGDPREEIITLDKMQFCMVPEGEFLMGSIDKDETAVEDEKPQQGLTIDYDYWLA